MSKYNSITITVEGITATIPEFFDCADCEKKTSHLNKHMNDNLDFICDECYEIYLDSADDDDDTHGDIWGVDEY